MPRYRIEELSFIDNKLVHPGDEIETESPPAAHWTPLDKDAKKASAEAQAQEVARVAKLTEDNAKIDAANRTLEEHGLA